jgi:glycogen debranching enzyme
LIFTTVFFRMFHERVCRVLHTICNLDCAGILLLTSLLPAAGAQNGLEIARPVHSWEAVNAVGQKAAWMGKETGDFEAWVYPLKILRDFHLVFRSEDHVLLAEPLARTVVVRPESVTIVYASDTFRVRETLLVPYNKQGALILLEIHSSVPMEVEARFKRDFQLQWPAVLADPEIDWQPRLNAFTFACENSNYAAIFGSSSAVKSSLEYATNSSASDENAFRLWVIKPGEAHKVIALAASVHGLKEAEASYRELLAHADVFAAEAKAQTETYLRRTVSLDLPDVQMQKAYDWARISLAQAMVTNPLLPEGMVAGYRFAGDDRRRPGYAWFFGRDALWTTFAWNAMGDFRSTRVALDFLSDFQRTDGKLPHEIPQTATLIGSLAKTDFAYAEADATPLYLIALDDYLTRSGDLAYIREKRPQIEKALGYLRSTFDEKHLAKNQGAGTGWIEGGSLYPMRMEIYQASLGVEALRCMSRLALALGEPAQSKMLHKEADEARLDLDKTFWIESQRRYAFALDLSGKQFDAPSVLTTVPFWFRLLPEARTQTMLDELARPEHQTDWGMRIISNRDSHYDPGGYHAGSVWPLFTGWTSVAEYRFHRDFAAYENLRTNVLLTYAGTPGRVTEVLSGDSMLELATTTPQQTWSSAMVIEPLLLGLFGLCVDASSNTVALSPHLPANWPFAAIREIRVGDRTIDLRLEQQENVLRLIVESHGARGVTLDLNPAFGLHARVLNVTVDGRKLAFTTERNDRDQHLHLQLVSNGARQEIVVRTEGNLRLVYEELLPQLGEASHGLRLINETWNSDGSEGHLQFAGMPGANYEVKLVDARDITHVEGAEWQKNANGANALRVTIPQNPSTDAMVILKLTKRK